MSALDAIAPTIVYRWPDGWRVTLYVDQERTTRSSSGATVVPVVLTLRGTRHDDRWSVAHLEHDVVWAWSAGSKGWQLPEVPKGEERKRLLGFLLDLGVGRPQRGIHASLVTQLHVSSQSSVQSPFVPYPRWVDDVRWEQRYEEARRFVLQDVGEGNGQRSLAHDGELYLGFVESLDIYPPGSGASTGDRWCAICHGQSECVVPTESGLPESLYFHSVIDQLLDSELLLPTSSRRAWESEHVVRGEWCLPSPDEVEIYRTLGEDLPLLWGAERLLSWLRERP